jgi:phosphorylcholine metabolism protein LicD
MELLKELTFAMLDFLEHKNITHWISYGTLLGAMRDQRIIAWTADSDIVVNEAHFSRLVAERKAFEQRGFTIFADKNNMARFCVAGGKYLRWQLAAFDGVPYYDAFPYVDIYKVPLNKDTIEVIAGPRCKFQKDVILPLQKIPFYDRLVSAPRNASQYLHQLYGPQWRPTPAREQQNIHGSYGKACQKEWQPE